jgi:hypothetical protein
MITNQVNHYSGARAMLTSMVSDDWLLDDSGHDTA